MKMPMFLTIFYELLETLLFSVINHFILIEKVESANAEIALTGAFTLLVFYFLLMLETPHIYYIIDPEG